MISVCCQCSCQNNDDNAMYALAALNIYKELCLPPCAEVVVVGVPQYVVGEGERLHVFVRGFLC